MREIPECGTQASANHERGRKRSAGSSRTERQAKGAELGHANPDQVPGGMGHLEQIRDHAVAHAEHFRIEPADAAHDQAAHRWNDREPQVEAMVDRLEQVLGGVQRPRHDPGQAGASNSQDDEKREFGAAQRKIGYDGKHRLRASKMRRSEGEHGRNWLRMEPSAPPVWMIGPSAPNGPPVPTVIAALSGLKNPTRGFTMLPLVNTTDIASGMPSPLISGEQ